MSEATYPDLAELKARDIPRCTPADIGIAVRENVEADAEAMARADEIMAALTEYFSVFAKPVMDGKGNELIGSMKCLCCGAVQGGMLGAFRWGICHGEGECSQCHYPGRAAHYPKDKGGETIFDRALSSILQYHPDTLEAAK